MIAEHLRLVLAFSSRPEPLIRHVVPSSFARIIPVVFARTSPVPVRQPAAFCGVIDQSSELKVLGQHQVCDVETAGHVAPKMELLHVEIGIGEAAGNPVFAGDNVSRPSLQTQCEIHRPIHELHDRESQRGTLQNTCLKMSPSDSVGLIP